MRVEFALMVTGHVILLPTSYRSTHCMIGMIVAESADNKDKAAVHAFVLGSNEDIAKMFSSLITITRNGIVLTDAPPNPNNEAKH